MDHPNTPESSVRKSPAKPVVNTLLRALGGTLLSFSALSVGFAQDSESADGQKLKVSGFGTLGLTYHNNRDVGLIFSATQDRPAWDGLSGNLDTVAGVQVDWAATDSTSVAVQALARAGDNMDPKVRMAYVRQKFGSDIAVRLGRLRSPIYFVSFDSAVAEIGYANMTVRPPIAVYFTGNAVPHTDGGDIQWTHGFGEATLQVQGFTGNGSFPIRFWQAGADSLGELKTRNVSGLAVSLAMPNFTIRAARSRQQSTEIRSPGIEQLNAGLSQAAGAVSMIAMNPFLPPIMQADLVKRASDIQGLINPLDMSKPVYDSLGFNGSMNNWSVEGELLRFASPPRGLGKFQSYHLTVGRNFGNFTPYVDVARTKLNRVALDTSSLDPTGLDPALDAGLAMLKAGVDAVQTTNLAARSYSAGVRWDFMKNLALKLQYDHIQSDAPESAAIFAAPTLPNNRRVNVLAATLDFVF